MKHVDRLGAALLLCACLQLQGCKQTADAPAEEHEAAKVEHLDGDEPARITLTEDAVRRLDIQTAPVMDSDVDGTQRKTIPYGAVLYDTVGDTWTYTNPEPMVYIRHHIKVERIVGDRAFLSDSPPSGMAVVIVGAAELYGAEVEFEEE